MLITQHLFSSLFPHANDPNVWVDALNDCLPQFDMSTRVRVAAFVSQCGVETMGWTRFVENMNYSSERLLVVFPKYFTPELAKKYEHHPAEIGNRVYGNRMGNGPEESGDGYAYRGRGPIHLTGRKNYTMFAQSVFPDPDWKTIVDNPDLVATDFGVSLKSALWFWKVNNLNREADVEDIRALTKKVNGGYNALDKRIALYRRVRNSLGE